MEMERNGREEEQITTGKGEAAASDSAADSAVTPILLFSVFIAVSGFFACGCATGYTSPAESAIIHELGLSTAQFSLFGSLLTAGSLFGSLLSGRITDLIGRRGAMGLASTLSVLGWIAISVSREVWSLYLGRSFTGVSMGLQYYVAPVYIAEITPKNLRGRLVSISTLMFSFGIVVMFFAGSLIPWRILVLIGIIPSSVQLLCIFVIPESPRFLAQNGQSKAHEIVLQRIRGDNVDISQEATEIEDFTKQLQQLPKVNFLSLFQRKYAHNLFVVVGLMGLGALGSPNGLISYASSVFQSAGFSSSVGSIVMAIVQVLSAAISVYLMDKCGRRSLLLVSAGAMSICCFLVGFMFLLKENHDLEKACPYFIVLGLWGYCAAFRFGMAGIPFLIMSEMFSINIKGSAGSLAVVVSSLCYWIVTFTFNFVTEWSYSGAFFIFAGINAFGVLFTASLVPETKGRTLEEIQQSR